MRAFLRVFGASSSSLAGAHAPPGASGPPPPLTCLFLGGAIAGASRPSSSSNFRFFEEGFSCGGAFLRLSGALVPLNVDKVALRLTVMKLSKYVYVCLVCLSVCLSVCLHVCLSLSVCLSVRLLACMSVCLCLSLSLSKMLIYSYLCKALEWPSRCL